MEIPVQITTTHQNRFWSSSKSSMEPDFVAGGSAFGSETELSGMPSSLAASRRASSLRPRESSQRTDSGTIMRINSEVIRGAAPVAATPRQPITGNRPAEIIAANMVPSATGTTIMLDTKVR